MVMRPKAETLGYLEALAGWLREREEVLQGSDRKKGQDNDKGNGKGKSNGKGNGNN